MKSFKKECRNRTEYINKRGGKHREDGPAVEWNNGDKEWWINNKRHRTDGPAVEKYYIKEWFINGKRHRNDGPAIEYNNGLRSWYLNGVQYSEEQYDQELIKLKLNRLVNL